MKQKALFFSIFLFALSVTTLVFTLNKEEKCANSITCIDDLSTSLEVDAQATYMGTTITAPNINLNSNPVANVLGESSTLDETSDEKHLYVDLDKQTIYAFNGDEKIFETLISTGKWGWTPTGDFKIWIKIRSTKMSGGSGASYYYLPNVPYVMFFYNNEIPKSRGYGLHGTYWHNNFGHEMSHGCVNLRTTDAETIYNWASPTSVKSTTHATTADPGTNLTICNRIELQEGSKPICLN